MMTVTPKEAAMSLAELGKSLDEMLDRCEADWFTRAEVASWRRDGIPDAKIWEYLMEED